jgi:hypothetical protein
VRIESDSALVDASGTITIELARVPARHTWLLDAIVILCTSITPTSFALYRNVVDSLNVIDKTKPGQGNDNVADEAHSKWLADGTLIVAQWIGASQTDANGIATRGSVSIQLQELGPR